MFNDGEWTAARMHSFVKGALRAASMKWPPKYKAKTAARVARGVYICKGYGREWHEVPASIIVNGHRKDNVFVDHIYPVVDPKEGFTTWDNLIARLFCNSDGLQILCNECHKRKTDDEKKERTS